MTIVRRTSQHKGSRGKSQYGGFVRIIAGLWRGRRLPVADVAGLRPSGDRVRETLFNWLQPRLPGARCLDLFAGTGALGFEAVSRGAAHATLIERDPRALAALRKAVEVLDAGDRIEIVAADALQWLSRTEARYDLIFVDPPFGSGLRDQAVGLLPDRMSPGALVYVESPAGDEPTLPPTLGLIRHKQIAEVELRLLGRPTPAN